MRIAEADLRPGAYVRDPAGLYLVDRLKCGSGYAQVVLEDALSPLTSERIADPVVPGTLGRSVPLRPRTRSLAFNVVRERFELVRHAPCDDDVASVAEYGHLGTAPT